MWISLLVDLLKPIATIGKAKCLKFDQKIFLIPIINMQCYDHSFNDLLGVNGFSF